MAEAGGCDTWDRGWLGDSESLFEATAGADKVSSVPAALARLGRAGPGAGASDSSTPVDCLVGLPADEVWVASDGAWAGALVVGVAAVELGLAWAVPDGEAGV